MEASTLQPAPSLARPRVAIGAPLLRLRPDEQLVELFRAGSEEAFRVIHDRYHKRLFAYARQMLTGRQDAEDAVQDVFVRAYSGLLASDRDLALRAWLFRIAHNRCVDELRKPSPPPPEVLQLVRCTVHDPLVEVDLRDSLRRLVVDIRRLPEQQRSALLMRELGGMPYAELSASLGISVGAVKSLLVRARLALAEAAEARDTACAVIREQLVEAHDHRVRPSATARKHMRDCVGCKSFRRELRGVSRQLAGMAPTLGPLGFLANLLGFSGGAGSGAAGATGGGAALFGGSGVTASAGGLALGANHVALLVAAVATAGGAVTIQGTILPQSQPAPARSTPVGDTHRSTADALPKGVAKDLETRGVPGITGAVAHAELNAAARQTTGAASGPLTHSSHGGATAGPTNGTATGSAGTAANGNEPPSSSAVGPVTTDAPPQLSATCPTAGPLGASGDQTATSGSAPAAGTAEPSGPAGGTHSSAASSTPTSCGSTTGSMTARASDHGSSPTASSTTSPGADRTSTGSGSGSTVATPSSSGASTSGSNATTTR